MRHKTYPRVRGPPRWTIRAPPPGLRQPFLAATCAVAYFPNSGRAFAGCFANLGDPFLLAYGAPAEFVRVKFCVRPQYQAQPIGLAGWTIRAPSPRLRRPFLAGAGSSAAPPRRHVKFSGNWHIIKEFWVSIRRTRRGSGVALLPRLNSAFGRDSFYVK